MQEDGFTLREATIGIIGLGLMGGSLALALRGHCRRLIGLDADPAAMQAAQARRIVDEAQSDPANLLGAADLVVLSVPVPAILQWLEKLPGLTRRRLIVLDIGSTKRRIVQAMDALPVNFEPIGGHPVCGREQLTLENSDAALFQGAPFILTSLARTTQRALSAARQIVSSAGSRLMEVSAEEHDRALASTSHLPFLLASALALGTPLEFGAFLGTGFRSTARLAATPASMMLGVLESNRDHIAQSIHRFRESLSLIESALNAEDSRALADALDRSRHAYESLLTAQS